MTQTPPKPNTRSLSDGGTKDNTNPYSPETPATSHPPILIETTAPNPLGDVEKTFQKVWWQTLSLKAKAAIIAVAIGVIPVVTIGSMGYAVANRFLIQQIQQESQNDAITLAEQIELFMAERYDDIQLLVNLPMFSDPQISANTSLEEKQALLAQYIESTGIYQDAIFFDMNGDALLHSQGKSVPNHKDSPYIGKALKTGQPLIYKPSAAKLPKSTIKIVAPVKDKTTGKMIGVLRLGMPISSLNKVVDTYSRIQKNYKLIDDFDAYFIAPNPQYIGKSPNKEFASFPQKTTDKKAHLWREKSQITGKKVLAAYAPITNVSGFPGLSWGVVIETSTKTILAAQKQLLLTVALGTSAAAIMAALIAVVIVNRLIRPILRATQAVEKIGQGKWDTHLTISGEDELALLGANINTMANQLKNFSEQQADLVEQSRWLAKISREVVTNEEDITNLFQQVLSEAKLILGVDRIVIYRFNDDWSGYIANEAVSPGWPIALNDQINDPCIAEELLEAYRKGRVVATDDVTVSGFHPDHQQLMTRLEIKANVVVPVVNQGQLFGLLIAHHCATTHQWQEREVNFMEQLAAQLGSMLDRFTLVQTQAEENKRSKWLKDLVVKLMESSDTHVIFNTVVHEIRQVLQSDRVIIYEFDANWQGTIIAESVDQRYPKSLGAQIADPCFAEKYVNKYRQGRVQATTDIYKAGLTQCHLQQLEPFKIKANLVAPIVVNGQLLGLLIAHHCQSPRHWKQPEIDFMTQAALQVGVALERAQLLEAQILAEEQQRQAKEDLQHRALQLLMQVEPISQGDLTVRAQVTEDEIGTIADAYNSTVENLRRIVGQVKTAAQQFSQVTEDNDHFVETLTTEASHQVEQISIAGDRLTKMTQAINLVAQNAEETLAAFQQANQSVSAGEHAMNETVEGMMAIKETVAETAKKVQHLGESSQKISKVVGLISRFAAQTHLLALKASIEAARAGEGGRGFAVIANEVRTLATSSAEATAEIETLVSSIQSETKAVAQTMEMGTQQVLVGTQLVEQTRQSLNQITVASQQINHLITSISQATQEQSISSEAMNTIIAEVAAIAENTSISAAHLSVSFQDVLSVAQQLQSSVEQFKVN